MIHHVFANRSNAGDWLSARGIQSLLAPLELREHLCDDPFVPETLEALRRAGAGDLVVVGGGGLFMDYFVPFWQGLVAIAERVPVCIWGVGYVDLKLEDSLPPRELLEEVVRKSALCRVRDELSRAHLAGVEIPEPVPCPSIAALDRGRPAGRVLLHSVNYIPVGAGAYELMCEQAGEFARRTGREYRETNNLFEAGDRQALDKVLGHYAAADLVLSSRLHGCIFGLAMGRKVLAVAGDRKLGSFMQQAGLEDWVLGLDELERLPERLAALEAQPSREEFIDGAIRSNREVAAAIREL